MAGLLRTLRHPIVTEEHCYGEQLTLLCGSG